MGFVFYLNILTHRASLFHLLLHPLHQRDQVHAKVLRLHRLHDFSHKQDSQLNISDLISAWRVVIEKSVTGFPNK